MGPSPKLTTNDTKNNILNEQGQLDRNVSQVIQTESNNKVQSDSIFFLRILEKLEILETTVKTKFDNMENVTTEVKVMVKKIAGMNTNSTEVVSKSNAQDFGVQCELTLLGNTETYESKGNLDYRLVSDQQDGIPNFGEIVMCREESTQISGNDSNSNNGTDITPDSDGSVKNNSKKKRRTILDPVCITDKFGATVRKIDQLQVLVDEVNQVLKKVVVPNSKISDMESRVKNLNELKSLTNISQVGDYGTNTGTGISELSDAGDNGPFLKSGDGVESEAFESVIPNSKILEIESRAENLHDLEYPTNPHQPSDFEVTSKAGTDIAEPTVAIGSDPFPKSRDIENDGHSNETLGVSSSLETFQSQVSPTNEEDLNEPLAEIGTPEAINSESPDIKETDSGDTSDDAFLDGLAPRDFKAGEYVLTRKRLLSYPDFPFDKDLKTWWYNDPVQNPSLPYRNDVCSSCYEVVRIEPIGGKNLCATCGWPIHSYDPVTQIQSTSCQKKHEELCAKFVASGFFFNNFINFFFEDKTYAALGVWNALLLSEDSKEKLRNLPDSVPDEIPYFKQTIDRYIHFVRKMENCKSISDEDLIRTIRVIFSNMLYPPGTYSCFSHKRKFMYSVYEGPSAVRILPHDCNPNCEIYIDPETFDAVVKTTRTVQKGEKLTISYIENIFPQSVHERDTSLALIFMPPCTCLRCQDPTEGGTFASAIKIPKDRRKKGKKSRHPCEYALPYRISECESTIHGDSIIRYEWNCECKRCLETPIPQAFVEKLIEELNKARNEIRDSNVKPFFSLKAIGSKFHPNHAALLPVRVDIALLAVKEIQSYMHLRPYFDYQFHSNYLDDIETAVSLLTIYQRTRFEDYRTLLLYQTFMRISQLAQRMASKMNRPNKKEFSNLLESIVKDLDKCSELKKENANTEESHSVSGLSEEHRILLFASNLETVVFNEAKKYYQLPCFIAFCHKYLKKAFQSLIDEKNTQV